MIADYEDLQESEAADIYVKRFKKQEVFVKDDYEFPCLPRPRPSSTEEMMSVSKKATKSEEKHKIRGLRVETLFSTS